MVGGEEVSIGLRVAFRPGLSELGQTLCWLFLFSLPIQSICRLLETSSVYLNNPRRTPPWHRLKLVHLVGNGDPRIRMSTPLRMQQLQLKTETRPS